MGQGAVKWDEKRIHRARVYVCIYITWVGTHHYASTKLKLNTVFGRFLWFLLLLLQSQWDERRRKKNKHIHITRIKWQPNLPQMWVKGTAINELSTHPVGAQCTYLFRLFFFFFLSLLIFFISATLFILFHYNDCNVCFTVFFCHSN